MPYRPLPNENAWNQLDQALAGFHTFQAETLRVHAQYLRDQLECAASLVQTARVQFAGIAAQSIHPTPHPVRTRPVRLKPLPPPDSLDGALPPGHMCLVTDDGTHATSVLVETLQTHGWPVAVLSFPASLMPERAALPGGVSRIVLENLGEPHFEQQFRALTAPIGAFIHLHPRMGAGLSVSKCETDLISGVFFLCKYLKSSLVQAAQTGRSLFATITRFDGLLGTSAMDVSPLGGGLFGLVKSLNLEWDAVFCRAIDLSPELGPGEAARTVIAELTDSDLTIAEVGCGPEGRFTLVCDHEPEHRSDNSRSP